MSIAKFRSSIHLPISTLELESKEEIKLTEVSYDPLYFPVYFHLDLIFGLLGSMSIVKIKLCSVQRVRRSRWKSEGVC